MNATKTESKLWGMVCVKLDPRDRTSMINLADLDESVSKTPWTASKYRQELTKQFVEAHGVVGPDRNLIASAIVRHGDLVTTLTEIMVRPSYRRMGVGTMLINCLRKTCLTESRRFLEAVVSDERLDAHLFFKKCGFVGKVIHDEKCDYYLFRTTKETGDRA